ncbi:hypothetical protein PYCCODRAFT_318702 [Trametes coccinea BRFM310]|uniref:Uncharacterized protein n=1 Tax=Trametes coccinea (strain BRFM310) TaxID=1353009 RepID=A0A1Y2IPI2_TRAC3|nr:hypothetical protein PYCCODRAFT_318702 [Trametes coccinea BRFM310]
MHHGRPSLSTMHLASAGGCLPPTVIAHHLSMSQRLIWALTGHLTVNEGRWPSI